MSFQIITDSAANLPKSVIRELGIRVLSLSFFIGNEEHKSFIEDRDFDYPDFYDKLRNKEHIKTSLINSDVFMKEFEEVLESGDDVLVLPVSSGISGTFQAAKIAADSLHEKYPERKIVVIDTLSASLGQGLLAYYAAKMKNEGKSIDETADWVYKNRLGMVHQFTVDDLFFLKRGGRLSGGVAIVGTILQIKPVLHVNNDGALVAQSKVNGRKKSIHAIIDRFKENAINPEEQVVAIVHGDCLKEAEYLAEKVKSEVKVKDIIMEYLDPVLGAHAGPGTLALFYLGKER